MTQNILGRYFVFTAGGKQLFLVANHRRINEEIFRSDLLINLEIEVPIAIRAMHTRVRGTKGVVVGQ